MKQAIAETIATESGVNAELIAVTEVAELLEGALVIDFGAATPLLLTAYEKLDTKRDIEDMLKVAVARALPSVLSNAVEIPGIALHDRRLAGWVGLRRPDARRLTASLAVAYSISVTLGS